MRRLTTHVLSEISGPLTIGFLIYTSILLIQRLFQSAEMIIVRGVPAPQVGRILMYNMPNIVSITVPMALLFGILVAVARMSADSEVTAIRACGQSLGALLRPILVVSALCTLLNLFLINYLMPRGNSASMRLTAEIFASSVSEQVEPRVFFDDWKGILLYVFDTQPGESSWRGIFLAKSIAGQDNNIHVAETGRVFVDDEGRNLIIDLKNAVTHNVDFRRPEDYELSTNETYTQIIEDELTAGAEVQRAKFKSLRELTIPELRQRLTEGGMTPDFEALAHVEIHKKFSIPFACFVFGLLGLGLGFTRRRGGGRTAGFALSIGVIMIYWVLISSGEDMAQTGRLPPWLAMWFPNLLLGGLGGALLLRRNHDRPMIPEALDRWLRRRKWGRKRGDKKEAAPVPGAIAVATGAETVAAPASASAAVTATEPGPEPHLEAQSARPAGRRHAPHFVLRLPSFRLPTLYRLDRYVLKQFLWAFMLITLSGLAVFSVADFTEKVDVIFKNNVPADVVLDYYEYRSFQQIYDLAPFAVLVTVLAVFGMLTKANEVIAAKASGISVYRLSLPAILGALIVVGLCAVLEARVLPSANQKAAQLEDVIRGREMVRSYRRADRNWLFGQGRYIYNYLNYDPQEKALHRLQVFEFDERHKLVRRLFADKATFVGDGWRFDGAWHRSFDENGTTGFERYAEPVLDTFPETPDYFESEVRKPDALAFADLREYIEELEGSGQKAPELRVALHKKLGYPAICLVMGLVGLPFAFRLGKKGALYGVGLGIILGMVFLGFFAFFTMLGNTGALTAPAAVWSPSIAFILLSLYVFLGVET